LLFYVSLLPKHQTLSGITSINFASYAKRICPNRFSHEIIFLNGSFLETYHVGGRLCEYLFVTVIIPDLRQLKLRNLFKVARSCLLALPQMDIESSNWSEARVRAPPSTAHTLPCDMEMCVAIDELFLGYRTNPEAWGAPIPRKTSREIFQKYWCA
jgi:hypothetical protein